MIKASMALLLAALLTACSSPVSACSLQNNCPQDKIVTIFEASSLGPAFDKIGNEFEANQVKAQGRLVYGLSFVEAGSQTLAEQLIQGASADIFASADTAHMSMLKNAGLLAAPAKVFAHNKLEIAVAKGNPEHIHSLADLARAGLVVVLADPSVPAGKYTQQALNKAHVTIQPASLELQVTGVLSKVVLGEADAGIVYASDVVTSGKVDGVTIPDDQNIIADYPIATLKSAPNPAGAKEFIDLLLSPHGQAILKAAGFEGV